MYLLIDDILDEDFCICAAHNKDPLIDDLHNKDSLIGDQQEPGHN